MSFIQDFGFHKRLSVFVGGVFAVLLLWDFQLLIWNAYMLIDNNSEEEVQLFKGVRFNGPDEKNYRNHFVASKRQQADVVGKSNIFGKGAKVVKKKAKVRKTRLNIKLIGVFSAEETGRAIIEFKGEQKAYGLGEEIDGVNAEVISINNNYVEILRDGVKESIEIDSRTIKGEFGLKYKKRDDDIEYKAGGQVSRNVSLFKNEIINSPLDAVKKIKYIPVNVNGSFIGYRVFSGDKFNSFIESMGLEEGDLFTSINGIELRSVEEAQSAVLNMGSSSNIQIGIERDGKPLLISIKLK